MKEVETASDDEDADEDTSWRNGGEKKLINDKTGAQTTLLLPQQVDQRTLTLSLQ